MPGCLPRQQLFSWLRLTPQSLILRDRHPINVISQHYPAPRTASNSVARFIS